MATIEIQLRIIDADTSQASCDLRQQLAVLCVLEPWLVSTLLLTTGVYRFHGGLGVDFVEHDLVDDALFLGIPAFALEVFTSAIDCINRVGIFRREVSVLNHSGQGFGLVLQSRGFLDVVDLLSDHIHRGQHTFE